MAPDCKLTKSVLNGLDFLCSMSLSTLNEFPESFEYLTPQSLQDIDRATSWLRFHLRKIEKPHTPTQKPTAVGSVPG